MQLGSGAGIADLINAAGVARGWGWVYRKRLGIVEKGGAS